PLLLVIVQPVANAPPAISTLPVEVLPICTRPVEPASSVRLEVPPAAILPPATNVNPVAETPIVSIVETPLKPPVVETSRPEESSWKVPVALPIIVLALPEVLIFVVPTTVSPPLPVIRPVEVKVPALVRLVPLAVRDVSPPEAMTTLPVSDPPNVNV